MSRKACARRGRPLLHPRCGPDLEGTGRDRVNDFGAEREVQLIRGRDNDALVAGEAQLLADVEEAFDLLSHAPHGLNVAELVDAARHGDVLPHSHIG